MVSSLEAEVQLKTALSWQCQAEPPTVQISRVGTAITTQVQISLAYLLIPFSLQCQWLQGGSTYCSSRGMKGGGTAVWAEPSSGQRTSEQGNRAGGSLTLGTAWPSAGVSTCALLPGRREMSYRPRRHGPLIAEGTEGGAMQYCTCTVLFPYTITLAVPGRF